MSLTVASFHWSSGAAPRWQPSIATLAATTSTASNGAFRFVMRRGLVGRRRNVALLDQPLAVHANQRRELVSRRADARRLIRSAGLEDALPVRVVFGVTLVDQLHVHVRGDVVHLRPRFALRSSFGRGFLAV